MRLCRQVFRTHTVTRGICERRIGRSIWSSAAALLGPRRQLVGQTYFGRCLEDFGYPGGGTHLYQLGVRRYGLGCHLLVLSRDLKEGEDLGHHHRVLGNEK